MDEVSPRGLAGPVGAAVLIVEDEKLIASSLARALAAHGLRKRIVSTVAGAISSIDADPPDLVLLDLGLPDGDGTAVERHVAEHYPAMPVIVLTARATEADVVLGLEAGAVDYVTKPFRLAELLARIDAHLRMRDSWVDPGTNGSQHWLLEAGDLVIDRAAHTVSVSGCDIALRPKEFDLLARLARDLGLVVTREELINDVWDENWWGSTKTLDVHVHSIRRKLGERSGDASRISTLRGVGYRLERKRTRG